MIQRYIALCDRDEACKTALAGQQVIVTIEDDRIADRVTDPKQPAFTVEEETHVDFGSKLVGLFGKRVHAGEHFCRVSLRLKELTLRRGKPVCDFRADLLRRTPGEQ